MMTMNQHRHKKKFMVVTIFDNTYYVSYKLCVGKYISML